LLASGTGGSVGDVPSGSSGARPLQVLAPAADAVSSERQAANKGARSQRITA